MIKRLKGTEDLFSQKLDIINYLEFTSRQLLALYGYKEIRTPIIEERGLFVRSVGKETDIVCKQMYSFKDQGERDICLRPEETASVVRAYLENRLDKTEGFVKLFYIGPMFRCERPQAGRLRQFNQIGVEAIGSYSPYADAEIIILLDNLLQAYGMVNYLFKINSLGCEKDKDKIKESLRKELKSNLNCLCDDCQRRYETNILRVLDCKNETCKKIIKSLSLSNELCKDCAEDFKILQNALDGAGIKYEVSPLLVRGLDYYTKAVFEVTAEGLGAQNAIAAGGRYDNLVSDLGGDKTGACGFAIGVERIVEILSKESPKELTKMKKDITYIVTLGEQAYREGFQILNTLRKNNIAADIDFQQRSLKAQMRYANKIGAKYVIIIGEDECKENILTLKNMETGNEEKVPFNKISVKLKE